MLNLWKTNWAVDLLSNYLLKLWTVWKPLNWLFNNWSHEFYTAGGIRSKQINKVTNDVYLYAIFYILYTFNLLWNQNTMKGTCIFILALLTDAVNSYIGVIIMADEDSQAKSFQCMIQSGYNVLTSVIQSDIDSI